VIVKQTCPDRRIYLETFRYFEYIKRFTHSLDSRGSIPHIHMDMSRRSTNPFDDEYGNDNITPTESISGRFSSTPPSSHEGDAVAAAVAAATEEFKDVAVPDNCKRTSPLSVFVNICSATLGAGAISLPYAFRKCGLFGGTLLLMASAALTGYSIRLLVESVAKFSNFGGRFRNNCGDLSYERMAHELCGPTVGYFVEFAVISFCFGICVAYIVAVGDMLEDSLLNGSNGLFSWLTRESAMCLFWIVFMFPLSCLKTMDHLKFSSTLGIISIAFLVFVTVFKFAQYLSDLTEPVNIVMEENDVRLWPSNIFDFVQACPIIMFAYSCQVNLPQIYAELSLDTQSTISIPSNSSCSPPRVSSSQEQRISFLMAAVRRAVWFCFFIYLCMGVSGYSEFGSNTDENILKNFCVHETHDILVLVGFVCISLAIVVAFPLNVFPCRVAISAIVGRTSSSIRCCNFLNDPLRRNLPRSCDDSIYENNETDNSFDIFAEDDEQKQIPLLPNDDLIVADDDSTFNDEKSSPASSPSFGPHTNLIHYGVTLIISCSSLLVALVVPDISVVFGLIGGTAGALLGFVMPAVFWLKLVFECGENDDRTMRKYFAFLLIIGGALIGILSTAVTLENAVNGGNNDDSTVCNS